MLFATLAAATPVPETAILVFDTSYSAAQPPLYAGQNIQIRYDLARAKCEHYSTHGADTWSVGAYWAFNGNYNNIGSGRIAYTPYPGADQQYYEPVITNVPKGDLAIWFACGSEVGTTWDSNYGKNWHFKIQ
ncbi:hypothetical protein EDD86DRAFT_247481 [Gorgonomyces haynaldii]|nr:hypothetical protein EDD86DRAFT_247481 [Gorgonomyces haynaldii]